MTRDRSKEREGAQSVEKRQGGQPIRYPAWPGSGTFGPFGMMRRFADEMDRVFGGGFRMDSFTPTIDIFEKNGKLVLRADLPGMTKDDVKVEITDEAITIDGERKHEHEEHEGGVYRSERSYGHFRREIPLPEGAKSETAAATFKNGVLEISIEAPQHKENRRRLDIQGEGPTGKPGQTAA
jgi:HSP20 family protein